MEALAKLERLHITMRLLRSAGISDAHPETERFLADFASFLMQDCGELDITSKCQLISEHMSKISHVVAGGALQLGGKDCSPVEKVVHLYCDDKSNLEAVQNPVGEVAMVGLDAMRRSTSTLEDFCRSYFMFHKMDANQPQSIFRYLPMLSFTESFIYQLDALNEKLLQPDNEASIFSGNSERDDPNVGHISRKIGKDPFKPLLGVLEHRGLLTDRMIEEFKCGEEYWALERKLCHALANNKEISIEDVTRAIHLKSFDYRILNLLLYQLRSEKVNELHMEFLSISELLVEISDDLFDYEDDVVENSFNVLRMFAKYYGPCAAPVMMAKFIGDAEEKYNELLKALEPELCEKYQKRCEEATREGGKIHGPPLGTWHIPPVIVDEIGYRTTLST